MKSILVSLLLTISIFLFYGCRDNYLPNEVQLKIKIVNNKPCFYIDGFDGMDKFNIQSIGVTSIWDNPKERAIVQWREGYEIYALDFHRGISRPIGRAFLFSPSDIAGSDKCVEYGIHIAEQKGIEKELADLNHTDSDIKTLYADINTALSPVDRITPSDIIELPPLIAKKLQMNVVYRAGMIGWHKEQWNSPKRKVQDIDFHVLFSLQKNEETGKIEVVVK